MGFSRQATHPAFGPDDQMFHPGRSHFLSAIRLFHIVTGSEGWRQRSKQSGGLFSRKTTRGADIADMLIHLLRDCQEFRVSSGMVSKKSKNKTHCAPNPGAGDPGRVARSTPPGRLSSGGRSGGRRRCCSSRAWPRA
jgi:hypothetical protein